MQSTFQNNVGLHVAIIMDGNGRWATRRGLPRTLGHRAGITSVRDIVEAAPGLGVSTLTLFAFSSDNWRRPPDEVDALMALLRTYLRAECRRLSGNGVRFSAIGRRDRLPGRLAEEIAVTEAATAAGEGLHLRLAIDYSARDSILRAVDDLRGRFLTAGGFAQRIAQAADGDGDALAVDLLIRTGGEKRLSDFLLWECAYAELCFTDKMWPDFRPEDLHEAIREFDQRDRRFGGVSNVA